MKNKAQIALAKEHGISWLYLEYIGDSSIPEAIRPMMRASTQLFFNVIDPHHGMFKTTLIYQY